jgi:hypothetical protein
VVPDPAAHQSKRAAPDVFRGTYYANQRVRDLDATHLYVLEVAARLAPAKFLDELATGMHPDTRAPLSALLQRQRQRNEVDAVELMRVLCEDEPTLTLDSVLRALTAAAPHHHCGMFPAFAYMLKAHAPVVPRK